MTTTAKVVFNAPIETEIVPPKPPPRGFGLDHNQIQVMVGELIAAGMGEGAIVVRRSMHPHSQRQPYNWGIVNAISRYVNYVTKGYDPLDIKWLNGTSNTKEWPEDLLIIYRSKTWQELEADLKSQE